METGICTNTLSCVFVSTCTSNCCTFMLIRCTTVSRYGVFQFNPGPATRANFPSRCTIATCAVCTVKNEPRKMLSTKNAITPKINMKNVSTCNLLFCFHKVCAVSFAWRRLAVAAEHARCCSSLQCVAQFIARCCETVSIHQEVNRSDNQRNQPPPTQHEVPPREFPIRSIQASLAQIAVQCIGLPYHQHSHVSM